MRIPVKITLAGIDIEVVLDPLAVSEANFIGKADYVKQRIIIDNTRAMKQTTEQSFCHELVHWILHIMGEYALQQNEKFVEIFSQLLYQAISTSVWEIEEKEGSE